jgi:hypothetical protein
MGDSLPKQIGELPKQISALPDELLINVLSHLPVEHRMGVRSVSQKWNATIFDIGYHLEPIFMMENISKAYYSSSVLMGVNPAIETYMQPWCSGSDDPFHLRPWHVFLRDLGGEGRSEELLHKRSEFITHPPISTITLMVEIYDEEHYQDSEVTATLRTATQISIRPEGIRIGDLLDGIDMVSAQAQKMGWQWYGHADFFRSVSSGQNDWEVVQQAKGKSGIEVRKSKREEDEESSDWDQNYLDTYDGSSDDDW